MDIDNMTDTISPDGSTANEPLRIGGTGGLMTASGTTAERPAGIPAVIRYNTDTAQLEASNSTGVYNPIVDGSNLLLGSSLLFSTSTTASDPGSGFMRCNTATPANIEQIYLSATSAAGTSIREMLLLLKGGDKFLLQQKSDPTRVLLFTIYGVSDNTTWFTLFVSTVHYSNIIFDAGGDVCLNPVIQSSERLSLLERNVRGIAIIDMLDADYTMTYDEATSTAIAVTGNTVDGHKLIYPTSSDGKVPIIQLFLCLYAGGNFILEFQSNPGGSDFPIDWTERPSTLVANTGGGGGAIFFHPDLDKQDGLYFGDKQAVFGETTLGEITHVHFGAGLTVDHDVPNATFTVERQNRFVIVNMSDADYTMTFDEATADGIIITGNSVPGHILTWPTSSDGYVPPRQGIGGLYSNNVILRNQTLGPTSDYTFVEGLHGSGMLFVHPSASGFSTFVDIIGAKQQGIMLSDGTTTYGRGDCYDLVFGSGLTLASTGTNEYTVTAGAGSVSGIILYIDFGDGDYYTEKFVAYPSITSSHRVQVTLVEGGDMTAEEAAIQGITITSSVQAGLGFTVHSAAPEGASGIIDVIAEVIPY